MCFVIFRGKLPYKHRVIIRKAEIWGDKKHQWYTVKLGQLFSAVEWVLAEMLRLVCGEHRCSDAAMSAAYGL